MTIVRTNLTFRTLPEPENENERGDVDIVWFHLSDGFVRNVGFLSVCISSKNRNWELVANDPS